MLINRRLNSTNVDDTMDSNTESVPFLQQVVIDSNVSSNNNNNNNNNNNSSNPNNNNNNSINIPSSPNNNSNSNANNNINNNNNNSNNDNNNNNNNRAAQNRNNNGQGNMNGGVNIVNNGVTTSVSLSQNQMNLTGSLIISCMVGNLCCSCLIVKIIQCTALYFEYHNKCDINLRNWLLVDMFAPFLWIFLAFLLKLPLVFNCISNRLTMGRVLWWRNLVNKFFSQRNLNYFETIWFIIGVSRLAHMKTCSDTSPIMVMACFITLSVFFTNYLLKNILIGMCSRFGPWIQSQYFSNEQMTEFRRLNSNLSLGNVNQLQSNINRLLHGAPQNVIDALPTRVFNSDSNNNNNSNDNNNNSNRNNNTEANNENIDGVDSKEEKLSGQPQIVQGCHQTYLFCFCFVLFLFCFALFVFVD